jgi:hypothetical protein
MYAVAVEQLIRRGEQPFPRGRSFRCLLRHAGSLSDRVV